MRPPFTGVLKQGNGLKEFLILAESFQDVL